MGTKEPSQYMTLAQLLRIKANNYLSEDCRTDYAVEQVDDLIIQRREKRHAREAQEGLKAREQAISALRQEIAQVRAFMPSGEALKRVMADLRHAVETVTGEEVCPFAWAAFENQS